MQWAEAKRFCACLHLCCEPILQLFDCGKQCGRWSTIRHDTI